ncbi:unnamed protein product, partial [Meganyctiphanes norvegica]
MFNSIKDILGDFLLPDDEEYKNGALKISNNESCRLLFKKSDISKKSLINEDNKISTSSSLQNNILAPVSSKYSSECNFDFDLADDFPVNEFDVDKDLFETQEKSNPPNSEFLKIKDNLSHNKHPRQEEKNKGKGDFRSRILKTITNSKNKKDERIEPEGSNKLPVSSLDDPNFNCNYNNSRKRSISPDKDLNFIRKRQNIETTKADGSSFMSSDFSYKQDSPNQIISNNSVLHSTRNTVPENKFEGSYPSTPMITPIKNVPPGIRKTVSPGGPVVCKRKFPGPAGLLPKSGGGRTPHVIGEELKEKTSPPQSFESVVCSQTSSDDFSRGPWQQMLIDLELDPSDPQCLLHVFNIRWVLRRASLRGQTAVRKVPFLAVMLRNLDVRSHADATATLKDKTGEINGTIPSCVIEEYGSSLQPGCVLFLKGVTVLSPIGIRGAVGTLDSSRRLYLNITLNTILSIYLPDESGNVITVSLGKIDKNEINKQAAAPKTATTPRAIVEEELEDIYENSNVNNDALFSNSIVGESGQNSVTPRLPSYKPPGYQSPVIRNSFNGLPIFARPGMAISNQRFQSPVGSQRYQSSMLGSVNNLNRNTQQRPNTPRFNTQQRASTPRFIFNPVIRSSTPASYNSDSSVIGNQKPSTDPSLSQADQNEVSQLFDDIDEESIFGDF